MDQANIQRINELTRLARQRELTSEEQAERAELRRAYVESMKQSLRSEIDRIRIVDEQGNKTKIQKKDAR